AAREDERQREHQRRARPRSRRQKRVSASRRREQQEYMEDEEAVQAERPDERRRDDAVQQCLREVESIGARVRALRQVNERRVRIDMQSKLLAALQKNAFRSGTVEAEEPFEVPALVCQIAVERGAQAGRDIRRFVALDAESGLDDVDG